jgi:hypothetical protein
MLSVSRLRIVSLRPCVPVDEVVLLSASHRSKLRPAGRGPTAPSPARPPGHALPTITCRPLATAPAPAPASSSAARPMHRRLWTTAGPLPTITCRPLATATAPAPAPASSSAARPMHRRLWTTAGPSPARTETLGLLLPGRRSTGASARLVRRGASSSSSSSPRPPAAQPQARRRLESVRQSTRTVEYEPAGPRS